jgi:hypothetical protein
MDQKIVVRPFEQIFGHSYIYDLGFKAYLDLHDVPVEMFQYDNRNNKHKVCFVYKIPHEEMQGYAKDYDNSLFAQFKMFMDKNRTLIHGIMSPMSGE